MCVCVLKPKNRFCKHYNSVRTERSRFRRSVCRIYILRCQRPTKRSMNDVCEIVIHGFVHDIWTVWNIAYNNVHVTSDGDGDGRPFVRDGKHGRWWIWRLPSSFWCCAQNEVPAIALHVDRRPFQTVRKRIGQKTYSAGSKSPYSAARAFTNDSNSYVLLNDGIVKRVSTNVFLSIL